MSLSAGRLVNDEKVMGFLRLGLGGNDIEMRELIVAKRLKHEVYAGGMTELWLIGRLSYSICRWIHSGDRRKESILKTIIWTHTHNGI
jgi:hypothetical protein